MEHRDIVLNVVVVVVVTEGRLFGLDGETIHAHETKRIHAD